MKPGSAWPRYSDVVFHHVVDGASAAGWQIVQRFDGREILLARPRHVELGALATHMQSTLAEQGVRTMPVQVREVAAIPRTALGKGTAGHQGRLMIDATCPEAGTVRRWPACAPLRARKGRSTHR